MESKFSLYDILRAVNGRILSEAKFSSFRDISTDSRLIRPGDLFIALKGEHYDGCHFLEESFNKGARGALVSASEKRFLEANNFCGKAVIIEVEDTLRALGDIAHFWRKKISPFVVAITGSNGKTTTKEMVAAILKKKFAVLQTEGNFNNLIGLPLTLLRLTGKKKFAVLEMGMNQRGEIRRLSEICLPDVGVLTNISIAHLENFETIEEIARAKGELLENLGEEKSLVVNGDDFLVMELAKGYQGRKIAFGLKKDFPVTAGNFSPRGKKGIGFDLSIKGKTAPVLLPLWGIHNIYNALSAASAATVCGIEIDVIKEGLESLKPLPSRMKLVTLQKNINLIDDTYNANPQSMEMALKILVDLKKNKRGIAVLGDMLELGKAAGDFHYQLGSMAGKLKIDYLFSIGEFASLVREGALSQGMDSEKICVGDNHKIIAARLLETMKENDWILIKGSRAMSMEKIIEELTKEDKKQRKKAGASYIVQDPGLTA